MNIGSNLCVTCETRVIENTDTGLCATCSHLARKAERMASAPKKKPARIKPRSEKRVAQEAIYNAEVKEWKIGKVCMVRIDALMICGADCQENHHKRGRDGDRLMEKEFWFPVCARHHRMITYHPEWAEREGYSLFRLPNNTTI